MRVWAKVGFASFLHNSARFQLSNFNDFYSLFQSIIIFSARHLCWKATLGTDSPPPPPPFYPTKDISPGAEHHDRESNRMRFTTKTSANRFLGTTQDRTSYLC